MPHQILKNVFGYDNFRPGQVEVVNALLSGENALAVMPTGSGKSLCFQIPALVKGGLTIVVSPLVALMEDQVAALKLAGVEAETINSSRDRTVNVDAWRRVAAGETRLLYLAPERLMTDRMLDALARLPVSLIAVDEAHCLSRWGPSFRPEYESLSPLKDRLPRRAHRRADRNRRQHHPRRHRRQAVRQPRAARSCPASTDPTSASTSKSAPTPSANCWA